MQEFESAPQFVAGALGFRARGHAVAVCGLCGSRAPCRAAENILKENFTNRDELVSPCVCWGCEVCLNDSRTRSAHLVTAGTFSKVERRDVWGILLSSPFPPFVLYLTLTGKKHGLFRQTVALGPAFRLQCEELSGWFDPAAHRDWMLEASRLRLLGVRRAGLETGQYASSDYVAGGSALTRWESGARTLRTSDLFNIIIGTMPGQEDLKKGLPWMTI